MAYEYRVKRLGADGKIHLYSVPVAAVRKVLELGDRYIARDIMKVVEREQGVKLTRNNVMGIKKKFGIRFSEKYKWYVTVKQKNKFDLERHYMTDEEIEVIKRDAEGMQSEKAIEVFWKPWGVDISNNFAHLELLKRVGIAPAEPKAEIVRKPHTIHKIGNNWFYILENGEKMRLSRYLYEWYNNEKLTENDVVAFANGDKDDFDRYNLIKMTKREAMRMYTQKKMTSNKELTKVNHAIVKLETKIKDLEENS